jgi:DNA-binding FadR family transcriptional regulator
VLVSRIPPRRLVGDGFELEVAWTPQLGSGLVLHASIYVLLRLAISFATLATSSDSERDLEILALRHQVAENLRFHRSIYSASGNRLLSEILDSLWDRSDRYRLILVADRLPEGGPEFSHAAIAAALVQRDTERVLALLRGHVETANVSLLRRFGGGSIIGPAHLSPRGDP